MRKTIKQAPIYEITKEGAIFSKDTGEKISLYQKEGYWKVRLLTSQGMKVFDVHSLVFTNWNNCDSHYSPKLAFKNGNSYDPSFDNLEVKKPSKMSCVFPKKSNKHFCRVTLTCLENSEELAFDSIAEAARFLNITASSLGHHFRENRLVIKGYRLAKGE